jgi:acetyl esterase/lipase
MTKHYVYITGREGSLEKGLAAYLRSISEDFVGLAVDRSFLSIRPLEQVAHVVSLLREHKDHRIIANSYGAYLTLQALVDLDVTPKDVILLSPVMGKAKAKDRAYMSRPPLTNRLQLALEEGRLVRPESFKLYIGDQDPIYDPLVTEDFKEYFGGDNVVVLEGQGHMLDRELTANIVTSPSYSELPVVTFALSLV